MFNFVGVKRPKLRVGHNRWFWHTVIPCGAGNIFFSAILLANTDDMWVALLPAMLATVVITGMMVLFVVKSYQSEKDYTKRSKEFEAITSLREIGWDDLVWLRDVDSNCVVYENHQFDHMEEYYVKFFNQTDEMLFNITRGQER